MEKFPSPVGESYFSIDFETTVWDDNTSFRPLSGNLIFQFIHRRTNTNGQRPRFRPLSGNLIFQ